MKAKDVSLQTEMLLNEYKHLTGQDEDSNEDISIDDFLKLRKQAIFEVEKRIISTAKSSLSVEKNQPEQNVISQAEQTSEHHPKTQKQRNKKTVSENPTKKSFEPKPTKHHEEHYEDSVINNETADDEQDDIAEDTVDDVNDEMTEEEKMALELQLLQNLKDD